MQVYLPLNFYDNHIWQWRYLKYATCQLTSQLAAVFFIWIQKKDTLIFNKLYIILKV